MGFEDEYGLNMGSYVTSGWMLCHSCLHWQILFLEWRSDVAI